MGAGLGYRIHHRSFTTTTFDMTLQDLQLILEVLTSDWTHADTGAAIQAVKTEIAKMSRKKRKSLGELPPHQRHSDTSIASALKASEKFSDVRRSVLVAIAKRPITDEEGQQALNMPGNSYRPCRVTLMDAGLVEDSGHRRQTVSKRKAVVWRITPEGLSHLGINTKEVA